MGTVKVSIWNCDWRDGRPRFVPGPKLRRLIGPGFDLKNEGGAWLTLEETRRWSEQKKAEVDALRKARADAKAEGRRMPAAATIVQKRARGLSVSELFQEWYLSPKFTGGVTKGKRRQKGLSAASIRDYKSKARALEAFDPELAAGPPAGITDELAQAIYERMWEQLGLAMANGVVAVCSTCWSWAGGVGKAGIRRGSNPWQNVTRTTAEARVVVLEDFEIAAWVAACDLAIKETGSRDRQRNGIAAVDLAAEPVARPELGDAIFLGLFSGQRQGDRLALLDSGRDDKGRRRFKQSKTGAIVAIPETPQLAARLAAAAERRKGLKVVDLHNPQVILDERRKRPFKSDHYRHLVAERRQIAVDGVVDVEATEAARVAGRNDPEPIWRLKPCPSLAGKRDQDLRDTAVTWLARAGCNVMQIASITGHSLASIHSILKHYLALHPEMADAAIGKLVEWMTENGVVV